MDRAGDAAYAQAIAAAGLRFVRERAVSGAVIAAYWPLPDEADPRVLLAALVRARYVTALPRVVAPREPLAFYGWSPGEPLEEGKFGLREPRVGPALTPSILLVPLAAFDRAGHRIGYGAGYYDRTLGALRARRPVLAVGVAFAAQEIAAAPAESHDQPLDFVLTERELIVCRAP